MSGIDHKAAAEELLTEAVLQRTGSDVESSRLMHAQVHATLELAEQQRIANLILFVNAAADGDRSGALLSTLGHARVGSANAQILEGLGLS